LSSSAGIKSERAAGTLVGVAVIGSGIGPNLIRNFYDATRARWCGRGLDEARLEEVASRFPGVRTTTDAERRSPIPTWTPSSCTPATTHFALAKSALEQGKHVLVEKPITTDAASGEALRARGRGGLVLMVGQVFLYTRSARVRAVIEAGELGRVYYVSMVGRTSDRSGWTSTPAGTSAHDLSIAAMARQRTFDGLGDRRQRIMPVSTMPCCGARLPGDVLVSLHSSCSTPARWRHHRRRDHKMLTSTT